MCLFLVSSGNALAIQVEWIKHVQTNNVQYQVFSSGMCMYIKVLMDETRCLYPVQTGSTATRKLKFCLGRSHRCPRKKSIFYISFTFCGFVTGRFFYVVDINCLQSLIHTWKDSYSKRFCYSEDLQNIHQLL